MRLYTFGNYYLSSIQQGIQAAHCVADMFVKYQYSSCHRALDMYCWAQHHKTMILLNGGNHDDLNNIADHMNSSENPFAWASFVEDYQSLRNCTTCVGIVLPERIYAATGGDSKLTNQLMVDGWILPSGNGVPIQYSPWERELISRINKCGLAR